MNPAKKFKEKVMGVDVSAKVVIGVYFETYDEGMDFVKEHFTPEEDFDTDNINKITNGLSWEIISAYSDSGGVIGIELVEDELDAFGQGVKDVWESVYKLMPADAHDQVKPHIWAQYW